MPESEKELFLKKFEEKLKKQLDKKSLQQLSKSDYFDEDSLRSIDYEKFRYETLPESINFYEKLCNIAEKIINVSPDNKNKEKINKYLYEAHLNCSPKGVVSASLLITIILLIISLITLVLISPTIGIGLLLISLSSFIIMQEIPKIYAKKMHSKANDEIIIAIFYIVAFMRFNSNLELAVSFAANYLSPPLSLDFKRILWKLDNSEFPTIKSALDDYLENWREDNLEFLEAIYLIESSLYESEEFRRISLLDKALDTILQGNYEKMLHFAQELRNKVTTFNMIGITLPILGLIILPLVASFGNPKSVWEVLLLLYDILIPVAVGYFGLQILFNRPTAVNSIGTPKSLKNFKDLQKINIKLTKKISIKISPKIPSFLLFLLFFTIGLLPLIFHITGFEENLNLIMKNTFSLKPFDNFQEYKIIENGISYKYGPYGIFPGILSLFIPLSFAFGIGYYLKNKYKNLIHIRDATKKLEIQFPSATFQLGNRINEGISSELAFGAVADTMRGTEAGYFFSNIDKNIKFNGLNVEKAIFDSQKGAINNYPSDLIISSMKIFVKASNQGPDIAAKTLIDLSKYLSEIHMSNVRMKDLLTESLGSMKSQISFLAPVISGIVISIVFLVTLIMGVLSESTNQIGSRGGVSNISSLLGDGIPTYLFQSVVGFYLVILIVILVYMTTNLENGDDPIFTKFQIGENLIKSLTKYFIVVSIGLIGFGLVGAKVLGSLV